MSASERESGPQDGASVRVKRRRLHGACDACRQRKIRCDSAEKPGQKCTNCVAFRSECTHVFAMQRKEQGPRHVTSIEYVTGLQSYIQRRNRPRPSTFARPASLGQLRQRMDPLLKSVLSGSYQTPGNGALIRESMVALARYARALEAGLPPEAFASQEAAEVPPSPPPPSDNNLPDPPSVVPTNPHEAQSINDEISNLTDNLKRSLTLTGSADRFFGYSSSLSLLDKSPLSTDVSGDPISQQVGAIPVKVQLRPQFWAVHPWEKPLPVEDTPFDFPPPDLLTELVRLYFAHLETCVSLLHRPSFERSIAAGLHLSDPGFGGVVLAVCAIASRYCSDNRVLLEGHSSRHSSGFKWFRQLRLFNQNLPRAPSLYDLQTLAVGRLLIGVIRQDSLSAQLAAVYLQGSSRPEQCWYLIGLGIRAAQDIGFNRKATGPPTVEKELRKRVFWLLFLEEAAVSSAVGRPPAITLSDIDVDLPIECDDEFWENSDPDLAFKQPIGIPSRVTMTCLVIKLYKIVATSQRAFYSVKRPDPPLGISAKEWDRITLANLDSELNAWVDSVPDFLRWNPDRLPDGLFFDQSAMLFTAYYHVQIFLHRPFVGFADDPVLALSSLAICTNAARACARIMEAHSQRGFIPTPQSQISLFTSGLMLTLHVWRARLSGHVLADEARELDAVQSCIRVLRTYEERWHAAGRFCDILTAMSSVGSLRGEQAARPAKRYHSSIEGDDTVQLDDAAYSTPSSNPSRGSRTSSRSTSLSSTQVALGSAGVGPDQVIGLQGHDMPMDFPFYSDELQGPFNMFNSMESVGYDLSLDQHLDELEAMWAQIQLMNPSGAPAPAIPVSPPNPNFPQFTSLQARNKPLTDDGVGFAISGAIPGASMWTTVPSGFNSSDDWQQFISNAGFSGTSSPLGRGPGGSGGVDGFAFL